MNKIKNVFRKYSAEMAGTSGYIMLGFNHDLALRNGMKNQKRG